MKSRRKQQKNECDAEDAQLLSALEAYNNYISNYLKEIEDFDIWFEENFQKDFPKCWYRLIRAGKL